MKRWIKDKMESDYAKRQIYMMGNLGLFYLILIALFGIPLLGTFVVVIIKGVLDLRHVILWGGMVAGGLLLYFGGKFIYRNLRKFRRDGLEAFRKAHDEARKGAPVQIEFFGGLVSLTYGGPPPHALPYEAAPSPLLLAESPAAGAAKAQDPIDRLKDLGRLKEDGVIDEAEFRILKKRLMDGLGPADSESSR